MKRCPKCGHENPDNATNCDECHINLQYAIANVEQFESEKRDEQQRAMLAEKVKNLLVTTTPTFENNTISSYLGVVSSVVVLGTGIFSELGAGVADLLGTRAGGFQEKLNKAREIALQEIKEQANQLGGDAIVGVDLDYMSLSTNMLMVSVNGTAVKLDTELK